MLLGVNIDHIAYLREVRQINDPDPLDALPILKLAAVDQLTIHLREDRRHINDDDLRRIIESSPIPVNLECSLSPEIIKIAIFSKPSRVTIVPENREEVTTEGGLNIEKYFDKLANICDEFKANDIDVSLFIDPDLDMIELSRSLHVKWVELHTGKYANIFAMLNTNLRQTRHSIEEYELSNKELRNLLDESIQDIINATNRANSLNINVAAGHGLNYFNVKNIVQIDGIKELNIGQSIIARSVFVGLYNAILDMKRLIE